MNRDMRVCFIGDSLVHGTGDASGGWVGRLAASTRQRGIDLVAYNLGVCGDTSRAIAARWYEEAERRLVGGDDHRVVFSFGCGDALPVQGRRRLEEERTAVYLAAMLRGAAEARWPVLVVGPPPLAGAAVTGLGELSHALHKVCVQANVGYVPVFDQLESAPEWQAAVVAGDDVRLDDGGHQMLAETVAASGWWEWLERR